MKTKSSSRKKTHESACPECGMPSREWTGNAGKGVSRQGRTYCCEGCANGTGCICGV